MSFSGPSAPSGPVAASVGRLASSAALGYALGCLPVADTVAKSAGNRELRTHGSGNPGASNVGKLYGRKAGALVFAGDVAKSYVACRLGGRFGTTTAHVAGTAAVIGHCYPATRRFRGGKGVATSFGQMLATFPAYLPVDLALGAAMARSDRWKDDASAAASAACALWIALGAVWWRRALPNAWGGEPTGALPVAATISSAVIITKFVTQPDQTRNPSNNPSTERRDDVARR